jgi:hypothetical protein
MSPENILTQNLKAGLSTSGASSYRAGGSFDDTGDRLGELSDLSGFWQGVGFGMIARPNFDPKSNGIFLQLNILQETLEIRPIGSPVLNRGSQQEDIAIYGMTYLHRVTDAATGGALHIEPGMWLNIPATTEPKADASIARLMTIPHGNAVCTIGFTQIAELTNGQPEIPPANTIPFKVGDPAPAPGATNPFVEFDLSKSSPYRTSPIPASITQALVNDPNQILRDALKPQKINKIVRLITSTQGTSGVCNIPFVTTNANAPGLESVFAIETIVNDSGVEFLQLQYSQTTLLTFKGMQFPHVTVGTLIKAF